MKKYYVLIYMKIVHSRTDEKELDNIIDDIENVYSNKKNIHWNDDITYDNPVYFIPFDILHEGFHEDIKKLNTTRGLKIKYVDTGICISLDIDKENSYKYVKNLAKNITPLKKGAVLQNYYCDNYFEIIKTMLFINYFYYKYITYNPNVSIMCNINTVLVETNNIIEKYDIVSNDILNNYIKDTDKFLIWKLL